MTLAQRIRSVFMYLAEGAYRLFSPHDDAYPATGIQPYSGTPYSKRADVWQVVIALVNE